MSREGGEVKVGDLFVWGSDMHGNEIWLAFAEERGGLRAVRIYIKESLAEHFPLGAIQRFTRTILKSCHPIS